MNKTILVGRMVADPEIRKTASDVSKCNFTVAVQRKFTNQNGVREADFLSCVAWRGTAEFIQKWFVKGSMIGVTGSLQTRSYDAQDGTKRHVVEVVVEEVEFVGSKNGEKTAEPKKEELPFTELEDDAELPF